MLYPELGFPDRFGAASRDGFTGVEYVGPYDEAPEIVAERLGQNRLTQVLFNLPAGDWAAGERGIACLPERKDEFRHGVTQALVYAAALGCGMVNCLAGIGTGIPHDLAQATLIENLEYAAPRFAEAGVKLLIEPINLVDIPGFFVSSSAHAETILDLVGSDNLFIQYDFYHMQKMRGELVGEFKRLQSRIAHVQIADNPGRHEPGSGEINYEFIIGVLDRLGYDGWIGAEYKPLADTSAGLGWMHRLSI